MVDLGRFLEVLKAEYLELSQYLLTSAQGMPSVDTVGVIYGFSNLDN